MGRIDMGETPLFSFVVLTDSHITDEEATKVDSRTTLMVASQFQKLLEKIDAMHPAFVIHLGDVTHPTPLADNYADAAREFHEMSRSLAMPLHLVPGNHDIGEKLHRALPVLDDAVSISKRSIAQYQQHFGEQYHSFEHEDCIFILINSHLINSGLSDEAEQWDWLKRELKAAAGKRIFLFSHYPVFLSDHDEPDYYDNIDQPGRGRLLQLIEDHGIEGVYTGHVHNYFYNTVGKTHHFTLPSTSFIRHDYLEFFRTLPESREMGRYDPAKAGFFWVDVFSEGHIPHLIRQKGRLTPRTHSWRNAGAMPVMDLRVPWCERADVLTPWGVEIFERKKLRNDYPLSALWEIGIRDLRIPISDLLEPQTAARVTQLAALGHRFVVVVFGCPSAEQRAALTQQADALKAIEIVAVQSQFAALREDLAALRGEIGLPIMLNPVKPEVEGYTSTHGLRVDDAADANWLADQMGLFEVADGFVFSISRSLPPLDGFEAMSRTLPGLEHSSALHVPCVGLYRTAAPTDEASRVHELNRAAEAAMLARAHPHTPIVLDNFVELDRGYFHCHGLVDRLYNPKDGSRILSALDALLSPAFEKIEAFEDTAYRCVVAHSGDRTALLLIASTGLAAAHPRGVLPPELAERTGVLVNLVTGEEGQGSLATFLEPKAEADALPVPMLFLCGNDLE